MTASVGGRWEWVVLGPKVGQPALGPSRPGQPPERDERYGRPEEPELGRPR